MSGTEPSVGTIEALVQSIEAKEGGPSRGAPPRSLVVASGPLDPQRAALATPAATPAGAPRVERRAVLRPVPSHPTVERSSGRPVTGLMDRAGWDRAIAAETDRQRRYGRTIGVVILELGSLDGAGPALESGALGRIARPCGETIRSIARVSDLVALLGERRFGVLLREADADSAPVFAARAIAACDPWLAASSRPLRLLVGSATSKGGDDVRAAVQEAERRLDAPASRAGRPA
jgi:GGDEF domain-containing protein